LGGPVTDERKERSNPRWVAPIAVWLSSEESGEVSGRVFEAGGGILAIAEGWHRGPTIDQVADPTTLGPIVAGMMAKARKNAGWMGRIWIEGIRNPSPLAGEGGPRSGSDEGCRRGHRRSIRGRSRRRAITVPGVDTPHPSASPTPSPARGKEGT